MKSNIIWDNSLKPQMLKPNAQTRYGYGHTAPMKTEDFTTAPFYDLSGVYGADIYSEKAARYFGTNQPYDSEMVKLIKQARGNPEAEITIYRAVPENIDSIINKGDWVSIHPQYAQKHIESNLGGKGKIIAKKVKAKDLFSDANALGEYGYDPQ